MFGFKIISSERLEALEDIEKNLFDMEVQVRNLYSRALEEEQRKFSDILWKKESFASKLDALTEDKIDSQRELIMKLYCDIDMLQGIKKKAKK
jgi:CRISPR/Cas system type I-B associated protein Csh2 (Cas7 group RAMP superfamily)